MADQASEVRDAGRGVIYIAFAKLYFMVAGAVIEFRLPAILSQTVFGAYGVVASAISPLNNVFITGTIQGVSRFTAQTPERARAIQAAGFRMHAFVGLPVAVAFIAMAPLTAWFFHDAKKTGPLMLAGLIVGGYAIYAVFVGTANGLRQFHKQAALDITMATTRAVGILGLAMAGFGLYGAISGWVGAVAVILIVSSVVIGWPGKQARAQERQPIRPLLGFFVSVAIYLILLNLIMFVDQLLLKRLTTEWFSSHGDELRKTLATAAPPWASEIARDSFTPSLAADAQVAYYRAVQNLARLSYQAIIAATFVIFPLISRATFENEAETTRRYVNTTVRYSLIFSTAIAVVFAANPLSLLDIPYSSDYAYFGAPALTALALGNVAFSIFAIAGAILNGAGLTRQAIVAAAVTLVIAVIANAIVIPRLDPGRDVLLGAAVATGASMVLGAAISGWFLLRHLGAFVPVLTVVRVAVATAVALGAGHLMPATRPLATMAEACAVGLAFLATLVLTRELGTGDLARVAGILERKKGAGR